MFGNLGVHVIKNPAGRYSFVGTLPVVLARAVPASTAAVMGCRAFRASDGTLQEWKFPTFATEAEAHAYAAALGVATSQE